MVPNPDAIQARCQALLGQVLGGRYRLDAVLGMGAMGAVFRARHTGLERDVALKLLHEELGGSDEMRARFAREAAAVSKLDHPNCIRINDFGSDGKHQYLVMELLQGSSLSDQIDEDPLPPLQAIEIIDEVLAGLEHAHAHGLVHRDIKPDNVFLAREEGGRTRVTLLDFGIVKLQEQDGAQPLTKLGMIFGTPCYMSPEQATGGTVDARTDLYAVGIVLYLLLAGRLPFDSDDPLKVLRQQIRDAPPPLPAAVPEALRAVVDTLLAKKPEERFASASAARQALAEVRLELEPRPPVEVPARAPAHLPPPAPARAPTQASVPAAASMPSASPMPGASPGSIPAPPAAARVPGPTIMGPSRARPAWPPSWWPAGLDPRWVLGGLGALVLVVILVVATGGDDPPDATPSPPADAAPDEPSKPPEPGAAEGGADDAGAAEDDSKAAGEGNGEASERVLQASLASVDELIETRQYEAARITLGHLLEAHTGQAQLHWRMARVLTALGGTENRVLALESYAAAIAADAALLDDASFMQGLWGLMDDPKLRAAAVELALEVLGSRADDRLLQWLNVQTSPLDHAARHRIIAHLEQGTRGDDINRPLQRALDLWQARSAEAPCEAFAAALREAGESPDSFLLGTLRAVPVPTAAAAEGGDPPPCPGAAEQLAEVRAQHDRIFAGIDPVVPKAYRKRPAASSSRRR